MSGEKKGLQWQHEEVHRVSELSSESNSSIIKSTFECTFCGLLWLWGYPTLLAFGLIGNVLCLMAFAAHKLRRETRFLCTLLSVFDTLSLLVVFVFRWPDTAFGISPLNLPSISCHLFIFANYWLPELASWTLVLISIERCLSGENYNIT